jgi:hypothetical protein
LKAVREKQQITKKPKVNPSKSHRFLYGNLQSKKSME